MFRPPSLLAPRIVPTAANTSAGQLGLLRPGLSCFVAAARPGYANRPNTSNWRYGDLHPARFSALSAAPFPSGYISSSFPGFTLTLDGSEHDGTLAVVGMTTFEGSPRVVDGLRPHPCMRWARDPDHDAVMRIAAKLRGGGPILYHGIEAMRSCGTPPPRTVIGDPWGGPKPSGGVATRSVR